VKRVQGQVPHEPQPACKPDAKKLSVKPKVTNADRRASLLSKFYALVDVVSKSNTATEKVHASIDELYAQYFKNDEAQKINNLIGNPPGQKNQNQRRIQPHAAGAPTTKQNKAATRASQKEVKASAKTLTARALGRG
jgi:hypothetical protein